MVIKEKLSLKVFINQDIILPLCDRSYAKSLNYLYLFHISVIGTLKGTLMQISPYLSRFLPKIFVFVLIHLKIRP